MLVTHNKADFRGYPGLVVGNWARALARKGRGRQPRHGNAPDRAHQASRSIRCALACPAPCRRRGRCPAVTAASRCPAQDFQFSARPRQAYPPQTPLRRALPPGQNERTWPTLRPTAGPRVCAGPACARESPGRAPVPIGGKGQPANGLNRRSRQASPNQWNPVHDRAGLGLQHLGGVEQDESENGARRRHGSFLVSKIPTAHSHTAQSAI